MRIFSLVLTLSLIKIQLIGSVFSESSITPWGVDTELHAQKNQVQLCVSQNKKRLNFCQKTCHSMIRFFQVYISPIDGPRSSFVPTSSQYALEAIQKYGVIRGIAMGCDRLMRENGELWVYKTTKNYGIERKLDPVR